MSAAKRLNHSPHVNRLLAGLLVVAALVGGLVGGSFVLSFIGMLALGLVGEVPSNTPLTILAGAATVGGVALLSYLVGAALDYAGVAV
jgi:hypothetical protein